MADLISGQLATTMVGLLMVVFYAAVTLAFSPLLDGCRRCDRLLESGVHLAGESVSGR